ncbi:hypothetical protein KUTeg_005730 [Tegillarca granosa]|uniref:Uncharacterized protein n=1 Tax=Tegillarca granosa TaxID=220873 RepID=A0ABQ9FKF0_TEGGR|nr:hypothetical protein KUTeg_005730 [Tegillarca granosa]
MQLVKICIKVLPLTAKHFKDRFSEKGCVIPGYDNDTYTTQSVYHENLINNYIPPHVEKKKDYDECHLFSFNSSDVTFDNMSRPINASLIKCTSWVYDDSIFKSTFTAEQNIVCEQSYKQTLAKTMFFAGVLVGAFALGVLSDVIGRKKTLHLSFLLMTASGVAVAFAPSYAIFVALRFLCGAGNAGVFMTAFVIGMELVGPSKRKLAGIIVEYFFALGLVLIVPESPRWLISQGKKEEAEKIMRKAAKFNKVSLPKVLFDENEEEHTGPYTLTILLLDRIGRKKLHCLCMVLGGTACLSTIFTILYGGEKLQALTVTLAMVGKLGAAAAFAVIYVFSAELYPTVVRNAGMGASSCCARIGGMVAPYVADSAKMIGGDIGQAVPLIIFGAASVFAGILSLWLPETLGHKLPETIEDGIIFGTEEYVIKHREKKREKELANRIPMYEIEISTITKL